MIWTLLFAVFLFLACSVLLVAEIFLPSGGLLTLGALACVVGGITLAFQQSVALGWVGIGAAVILIPTVLVCAYRVFPRTRFGQSVTLTPSQRSVGDAVPDTAQLKELLGETGKVKTPLRPVGICDFSGRRLECVAESGYVETGNDVEVIRVQGTQLTVRVKEG
jgi:membrane-bound ClpP family serine protease